MAIKVTWEPGYDQLPRFFWTLEEDAQALFEQYGIVNELTTGENVFKQGQKADALYIVLEGEVTILKDGSEIARVGQSVSFGEMGLLLGQPRGATARAVADSRILELGQSDLDRMVTEEPAWAARLYRVLAECLAEYLSHSKKS